MCILSMLFNLYLEKIIQGALLEKVTETKKNVCIIYKSNPKLRF